MKDTKIEWCDHTWSPWRGCTKVSPGCSNCYAEGLAKRFGDSWGGWGKGAPRVQAKNWADPVFWSVDAAEKNRCKGCGRVGPSATWREDIISESPTAIACCPDNAPRPYRPTVFPSLCDWLDPEVPVEFLVRFLGLVEITPHLTWLLLTKRPELWRQRMDAVAEAGSEEVAQIAESWTDCCDMPDRGHFPPNVWVGTSVEDQQRADERIPHLLDIPAAGRFLSVEPLLGPVELDRWHLTGEARRKDKTLMPPGSKSRIDWVIIGGESGPGARPCNVEWVRSIVRQCQSASVPCFVKQFGARPVGRWTESPQNSGLGEGWPAGLKITHPKGGDPAEWPEDLRVRQFPSFHAIP